MLINKDDLAFFRKLTGEHEKTMSLVLLSLFKMMLKRFFTDTAYGKFILPGIINPVLFDADFDFDIDLKGNLEREKALFSDRINHHDYDLSRINLDLYADCTFSFNTAPCASHFDKLELNVLYQDHALLLNLSYASALIGKDTVVNFLDYYAYTIAHLQEFVPQSATGYTFLLHKDAELIERVNATRHLITEGQNLVDIFEKQVGKTPSHLAVKANKTHLTYSKLNELANQFSYFLRHKYDVRKGDIVALDLARSEKLIIAIFGILKAAAAYLPIDHHLPLGRKEIIIKDSGAKLVIDEALINMFIETAGTFQTSNPVNELTPNDLAYLIYTSGSTGMPKGVMIEHSGIVNRLFWMQHAYPLNDRDVLIQKTNYSFDVSVWEMFWWSLFGATLYVPEEGAEKVPELLVNEIRKEKITTIHFVPSMFAVFLDYLNRNEQEKVKLSSLKQVFTSGEALPVHLTENFYSLFPAKALINLYGPTEASIDVTFFDCRHTHAYSQSVPIGKPIWNTGIRILDEHLYPVPVGVVGNLYIEGIGLARGYLNRTELTLKRFILHPLSGERMYDSGDLAKWLPDGNIAFLGRRDFQVKIRGHRIELGEIENTLMAFDDKIVQSVVEVKDVADDRVLVAYYVPKRENRGIDKKELKSFLHQKLPEYMVPAFFIELEDIPLTSSGKADRKALPSVSEENVIKRTYVAPKNDIQQKLIEIWQAVLRVEKIGITDNFFDLGGHSLKVGQAINSTFLQLSLSIGFKDFFSHPTIEGISDLLQEDYYSSIPQSVSQESYPLTPSQQRLWVISNLEGGSQAYNMPAVVTLNGTIDVEKLESAFKHLIRKYEILRTSFREDDESQSIRQFIQPENDFAFKIEIQDFTEKPDEEIESFLQKINHIAFDLEKAPLIRSILIKRSENQYIFFLSMHHLIGDGWSTEILISEIADAYNKLLLHGEIEQKELRIQYKDYAVWLEQVMESSRYKKAEEYWLKQFSGDISRLDLPRFESTLSVTAYHGAQAEHVFDKFFLEKIKGFADSKDATLFMALLSGLYALLYRYTNQNDIILGTPVAGRDHPDLEDQIGLFLNTLAIRTVLDENETFASLLMKVRSTVFEAYEHQFYPFDQLIDKLGLKHDQLHAALFDILVVLQNQRQLNFNDGVADLGGVAIEESTFNRGTSQFDLSFVFTERDEKLVLLIEYNTDRYHLEFINRIFAHFEQLINAAIDQENIVIGSFDLLGAAEKHQVLEVFNGETVEYPLGKNIIDLFDEQVLSTPEHIAVIFRDIRLSYRALDSHVTRLANYLRQYYNIKANDLIAIKLERSEQMIIAVLGILKSGAAYVPVDTEYPQDRVNFILQDTAARVLIDDAFLHDFWNKYDGISAEKLYNVNQPDDLAYVIYTSGSTGNPKGVMNTHGGLYNRLMWMKAYLQVSDNEVFLQKTPYTFDVSVWELILPFITGCQLVIAEPEKHKDTLYLEDIIALCKVSIIHFVPSMLGAFLIDLNAAKCTSVHHLICSGEELPSAMVQTFRDKLKWAHIHNLYGPTEAGIDVTAIDLSDADLLNGGMSIGKPIANTSIYIVNTQFQLQPVGVPGELLIAGVQVAKGYLHLAELTAQRFIPDPFRSGNRMYCTGDIARWLPDGRIQYLGRRDNQVKIRGNRIELGEVENAISSFAGVRQTVVADQKITDEKVLVAYIAATSAIDYQALKKHLKNILPVYMLPDHYVEMETIPLTSSGKADRKKLPLPTENSSMGATLDYVAPRNGIEEQLANLWKEILGHTNISINDSFFELGGHSLKATRLISKIYKVFNTRLALKDVFNSPTLEEQAVLIAGSKKTLFSAIPLAPEQSSYPMSSAQRRSWVLSQFSDGSTAYHMPGVFEFEGNLDAESLNHSFSDLIERHEILRTVFHAAADGEIRQYILPASAIAFKVLHHDLQHANRSVVQEKIKSDMFCSFDLSTGPLLSGNLYQLKNNKWIFSLVMHHIISDGWSVEVMIKELLQLYHAHVNQQVLSLPPLRIQYKDYAVWQQHELHNGAFQKQQTYWLQQLSGALPVLEMPTDRLRPAVKTYHGGRIEKVISPEVLSGITALCQAANSTLFMGLFAVVNTLIYRYSGQEDIIIGSPVSGRVHADLEGQIGFYVNTLALRTQFRGTDSFRQLLANVKQLIFDAYEYQSYPFDVLVDELGLPPDLSRNALFDVMVLLQHESDVSLLEGVSGEVKIKAYENMEQASKFDLQFIFIEEEGGLKAKIVYNTDLFHETSITQLLNHLDQLLTVIISHPDAPVATLNYLNDAEQKKILSFNQVVDSTPAVTITSAFKSKAKEFSDRIALVAGEKKMSYQELDEVSDQLASYLKDHYDVKTDDLVGIQIERNEWMIISLLGILKAGAAFVPIDPAYPQERIDYIKKDSKCKVILDEDTLRAYHTVAQQYQESVIEDIGSIEDLAYVIYTSGSTGRPKGVMISHGALHSYILTIGKEYGVNHEDSILQLSNFAFDAAIEQIMLSLLNGAILHVIPQSLITDVPGLNHYLYAMQITHLHGVPTLLQEVDFKNLPILKRVVSGGEVCPRSLIEKAGENISFYNKYGPTEATISATLYRNTGLQDGADSVPIGKPLSNSQIFILSEQGQLQPIGVPGELFIGGKGLARGYMNQLALTEEKFNPINSMPGQRLYRTGDVGRWLPDGNIRFMGRKDDQVKIRGHRIELGEITHILQGYEGISAAITVAVKSNHADMMVAYIVGVASLHLPTLRIWLSERLPLYMVPGQFIQLENLPLLPNGKVNKKALPALAPQDIAYVAPRNAIEKQLVEIWKTVLDKETIGVTDNFFELGGHSLKAMQILSEIHQQFSVQLSIPQLFKDPYIEHISNQISFIQDQQKFKSSIDQLVQIPI